MSKPEPETTEGLDVNLGVDLSQDPFESGHESRTSSEESGLSQDVCQSEHESGTSKGVGRNQRSLQVQA